MQTVSMVRRSLLLAFLTGRVCAQTPTPRSVVSDALRKEVEALEAQKSDAEKKYRALEANLRVRRQEKERDPRAAASRELWRRANAKYQDYVATTPALAQLRATIEDARRSVDAARRKATDESLEGKAILAERERMDRQTVQAERDERVADFQLKEIIGPRLLADNRELREAAVRAQAARQALDQARREHAPATPQLTRLRAEAARWKWKYDGRYHSTRSDELIEAWEASQRAEANCRAVSAQRTQPQRQSVEDARKAVETLRRDKLAADKEATGLETEKAELAGRKAEIEARLRLIEVELREGPCRRLTTDPDLLNAEARVREAEEACQRAEAADPRIGEARRARGEAKKKAEALEQSHRARPEVAEAWEKWQSAEKAASDLQDQLDDAFKAARDARVRELEKACDEARTAEEALRAAAYDRSPGVRGLLQAIAEAQKRRDEAKNRIRELDEPWRQTVVKASDHPGVKAAIEAEAKAREDYERGYRVSDAPSLDEARKAAAAAYEARMDELVASDPACVSMGKEASALRDRAKELDRRMRDLNRRTDAAPPVP